MLKHQWDIDSLAKKANLLSSGQGMPSKERWQAIQQCNQKFLQNETEDLSRHPYMNQEVVASWVRSRNMGVNPHAVVSGSNLNPEKLNELFNTYRLLIDITKSVAGSVKEIILSCDEIIYLLDKNGVILFNEGVGGRFPFFSSSRLGIVADENSEGTTAHELCVRLKRPVQLLGPEHYCVEFQNCIASAVPIKDENEEVLASLVLLSKPLLNALEEDVLKNNCLHSLGLITSLASVIEAQLKMVTVHTILNSALASVDEGIITIDSNGRIIHSNQEGIRILKLRPEEIGNRNISEFLGTDSKIATLVGKGENAIIEERIGVDGDRRSYQVSIRTVLSHHYEKVMVAVLKLTSSEKIAAQLTVNKAGSMAKFVFEDIISKSKEFKKTITLAKVFANTPENILLIGESGTGKELFAQAIHNANRPQGPFMAVNCAAMPRELIESELFGYESGSFTGAERSGRPGKIELAHGGTLFLDEIGDMPLELQAVLLRALEDKQIMRLGGRRYKKIDFRLVTATNKDLHQMVKEKQFREDLYFRLSVLTINIPPLRERGSDTEVISKFFVENYCRKQGWEVPQISPAAQTIINKYPWPGNVRQLQNAMIYAVNTAQAGLIKPENLPNYVVIDTCPQNNGEITTNSIKMDEMLCLETLEKAAIETALLYANNCVPVAAEKLGISRSTLYRKLKDYNIDY